MFAKMCIPKAGGGVQKKVKNDDKTGDAGCDDCLIIVIKYIVIIAKLICSTKEMFCTKC